MRIDHVNINMPGPPFWPCFMERFGRYCSEMIISRVSVCPSFVVLWDILNSSCVSNRRLFRSILYF